MTGDGDVLAFRAAGQDGFVPSSEVAPPVCATRGGGAAMPTLLVGGEVRRATPGECLALQGFPPGFLDGVAVGGRPACDTDKYRMIGNSWAVPLVGWVLRRIDAELAAEPPTSP
jgi:DNA (cytosine-5)-methyltransferase 1